ncbi:unnamed protein product [Kuraishia capsulata CBS 1993]|uniref:Uncharacterized protein n=1 Tax=Kuraishia capsulata CBS 1993 TaxID=1382522 RepID=W6MNE6_9ASCO|nr:uncharacterized protein KUCA_T00004127001 [Kuraishia capsulata CBS 1993]CDK28146.1 unnamed protein product [Kuraishia capsulata CBS 1993]
MAENDSGASLQEQLLESARRNNAELLESIIAKAADSEALGRLINETVDPLSNTALHICAKYGSFEVLDILLDQEGVEVDPVNLLEGETPLHLAVKYSIEEPEHGAFVAETLLDAGADPRIKNKSGLKPVQLVHNNDQLQAALENAEYTLAAELEGEVDQAELVEKEGEEGEGESASDSD